MEAAAEVGTGASSKEYMFDSIKQKVETVIESVVQSKCKSITAYDPRQGQAWSNEIAEEIVRQC